MQNIHLAEQWRRSCTSACHSLQCHSYVCCQHTLCRRYRYATYTIELMADSMETGLGGSSLHSAYAYSLCGALLAPTCVVLDCHSWDCMKLAYAMDMQCYIHLPLPPVTAAAAYACLLWAYALHVRSLCLIWCHPIWVGVWDWACMLLSVHASWGHIPSICLP